MVIAVTTMPAPRTTSAGAGHVVTSTSGSSAPSSSANAWEAPSTVS